MGWIRVYEKDEDKHRCDLPSLDEYQSKDHKRVLRMRWMCPECQRVYKPWETEMGMGPIYEWSRAWPWEEWKWRRRAEKMSP